MAGLSLDNKAQIDKALAEISSRELAKLLRESGRRMIRQYQIFKNHWDKGQGSWAPPSPAYAKWLKRKYGTGGKFEATGTAAKMLAQNPKSSGDGLVMNISKKYNSITIHLRKMVNGKNVYAIAQQGRFGGVVTKSGKHVSAQEVRDHNARAYKEFSNARDRGSKVKLSSIAARRAKEKGLEGATRASSNQRPITKVMPEDVPSIQAALMTEIETTLRLRGLL